MNPIQNTKTVLVLPPEAKDNGDFAAPTPVDTAGWGHLRFEFLAGSLAAAIGSTAETAALKIEECDTSGGSYTDKTGAALADAIADDEDDQVFAIDINLQNGTHKRYMQPNQPHAGDGSATASNLAIIAILSKPSGMGPGTAAEQGLAELVVL
ncbi:MAG: hypothetical protein FVQ82_12865 [Planctomycetes bacterium]|nr:hypothetical protein [Planctomycetota bacterium]